MVLKAMVLNKMHIERGSSLPLTIQEISLIAKVKAPVLTLMLLVARLANTK